MAVNSDKSLVSDLKAVFKAEPWGSFPGIRALAAAPLQDGRFTVRLDSGRFDCFLMRKESPYLFVMLSGARDPKTQTLPKLDRWSWCARFPGSVICVSDPTLYLRDEQLHLGWYVGTDEKNWQLRLVGLIQTIAEKLCVNTNNIICYGSSGGGFASLMLASHLKNATAVAINPQTNILKYTKRTVTEFLETCFSGRVDVDLLPAELARMSAITAFRRAPGAKCLIVQNQADTFHYERHYKPFCDAFRIPFEGGADKTGRAVSIVYTHPNGHGREPAEIVKSLISAAVNLTGLQLTVVNETTEVFKSTGPRIHAGQLYLINNKLQIRHKEQINFAAPGRADLLPFKLQIPIPWNVDPYADRNWCAQLHMWRLIDNHLLEFERTNDVMWLKLPIAIIDDWYDFHVTRNQISKFAWMDMMVGLRAMKLAFVISAHQSGLITLQPTQLRAYEKLAELHLDFLLDINNVSYSNHTFIDMHGLAALGSVVHEKYKAKIDSFLKQVIPLLISSQFNEQGVHLENSTGYQFFGIQCLKRLKSSKWFDTYNVDDLLHLAHEINTYFKMPDGRCVPIGDTDGAPMTNTPECCFTATCQLINMSGYVIARDDGKGRCEEASYIFFMAAFNSRFHKQCDDLSCVWFEGEDILCDAGKFGYKASEMRGYAQSTRAHNTIEIDGKNSGNCSSRDPSAPYGSAVKQALATDWGCVISGSLTHANVAVKHTRHLIYAYKKWLLVIDRLTSDTQHDFTQWFHFSPHLDVVAEGELRFGAELKNGKHLSVISSGHAELHASTVKGQLKPVRQGWISQAYGTLTPNVALGYSQSGKSALFVTLLSIDDIGSTVSVDGHSIELNALTKQSAERFVVQLEDEQCSVVQQVYSPDLLKPLRNNKTLNKLDLKYRYGFLITAEKTRFTPLSSDALSRWNIVECGNAAIAYHYEAKLVKFDFPNYVVYALGDIFVAHCDTELRENLHQFAENDDWDAFDNLSGRFAIIVYDKATCSFDKVLADPFGSRTLFYSLVDKNVMASHSSLLAETIGIVRSSNTLKFVKSPEFLSITTKFLPADLTMFEGIFGVPSNHYYSFQEQKVVRFWPRKPIEPCSLTAFLRITEEYFKNYIDYFAASGIKPVIGLTGGVDCRVLVAAWDNRKAHFKCLTWDRNLSDEEQVVIQQIRSYINADSYVLDPKKSLTGEYFDELKMYGYINRGEFLAKASLTAQTAEFVDPSNVFIRGLGGEILRGMYNKANSYQRDLDDFSYAISMYKTRKVIKPSKEFMSFLENAYRGFFDRIDLNSQNLYNYDFGDLIYWEQRMSMWAASLLNEADPALKNFAGLNSRRMYEASYGLPSADRFQRELLLKITSIFDSHLSELPTV